MRREGSTGTPTTPISAAEAQGPPLASLLMDLNLTNWPRTEANVICFSVALPAKVPVATGLPQFAPSVLTETSYCEIQPSWIPSCRGRYLKPLILYSPPRSI